MSELDPGLLPGLPPAPPAAEPRVASAVILWREGPAGRELFWVRRGAPLRFAGGFYAFPGGRLDAADHGVPVPGLSGEPAALLACAARELFEETGVLLAAGASRLSRPTREAARRALLDGALPFGELLARHGLGLDASALAPAGRWITPDHAPLRYDAHLFVASLPEGEAAEVWPGELSHGEWIAASEALRRWEAGEVLLHPPNHWGIACLARSAPPACLEALRTPPATEGFVTWRIEFQKGLFLVPLRTPTLPPATHTNCHLVDVGGGLALVDPGSSDPAELARLLRVLDVLAAEGLPPREIWLTHAHADHTGGVAALRARLRLVLRAHPAAAARLPAGAGPAEPLLEGDLLGGRWRALHTPGHAAGHLAFLDERSGALLAGDLVSTLSTIVIDPPEGDMAVYLRQLERMRSLAPRTVYPAHGAPAPDGVAKLDAYLEHRRHRREKVRSSLPGTLPEVTARAYDDTIAAMLPVAARSCLATLIMLEAEGRARQAGGRWASV